MAIKVAAGGRRAMYTYRTMNEIMNDLCTLIHDPVTSDYDEDTSGGGNHLLSALWIWTNANTLPKCVTETVKRAQAYRKWLEQQIIDDVTTAGFHIGANNSGRCPLHISQPLAGIVFQIHTKDTMKHFSSLRPSSAPTWSGWLCNCLKHYVLHSLYIKLHKEFPEMFSLKWNMQWVLIGSDRKEIQATFFRFSWVATCTSFSMLSS